MFGFGTLTFEAQDTVLKAHFVPGVTEKYGELMRLRQEREKTLYNEGMKILPADAQGIEEAVNILRNGGIVAHATETCYGLAADLCSASAIGRLFAVKARPEDQPVSALFASVEESGRYVTWSPKAMELAEQYLPGPLTIILPVRQDAPRALFVTPDGGSFHVGVRISSHTIAMRLAAAFGHPLSTTSANLHSMPATYSRAEIEEQFAAAKGAPDLLLDSGILPRVPPSTVVDLRSGAVVVRSGSVRI